jgi:hypothetical protein
MWERGDTLIYFPTGIAHGWPDPLANHGATDLIIVLHPRWQIAPVGHPGACRRMKDGGSHSPKAGLQAVNIGHDRGVHTFEVSGCSAWRELFQDLSSTELQSKNRQRGILWCPEVQRRFLGLIGIGD